jgi:CHAT domain-containing protein
VIGRTRLRAEEPLELLVLSACETAAGDDRAALGLAGVALQWGARSAIATLWSVNDEAAEHLVRRFYSEIGKGRSRADALQEAQLSLLVDPKFAHPANWAAFLLISSWL